MNQQESLKMAITQMVELSKELLRKQISQHSKLNQYDYDEQRELEKLYYNEIAATANVIRLFTGREISFQWCNGADKRFKGGFALYDVTKAPSEKIPCGVISTIYNRYSGKHEPDRRVDWSKGKEEGHIVKIYELIYDETANPRYVGGYIDEESR